jgi:hypothetical protein
MNTAGDWLMGKEEYWLFHFFIDKTFQRNRLGSDSIRVD